MNDISRKKYNYIRAEQLKRQSEGIPLMPFSENPALPEWNEGLALPPSYSEYLQKKADAEKAMEKKGEQE